MATQYSPVAARARSNRYAYPDAAGGGGGYTDSPYPGGVPAAGYSGPTRTGSFGTTAPTPDLGTNDPNKLTRGDRTYAYGQGANIDQQILGETQYQSGLENQYRPQMNTAYSDLQQTPGLTPEEQAQLGPSTQQTAAMTGDPYAPVKTMGQQTTGAINGMNDTMNWANGTMAGDLQGNEQTYATQAGTNEADSDARIRSAIDPTQLGLTADASGKLRMSDADVQGMQNQAATTQQNEFASAVGDLERNAAATGNASPMAVAAARSRLERQASAAKGDAMLNARLGATAAQRQAESNYQGLRLNANQAYANLSANNEQDVAARRFGITKDIAGMKQQDATTMGQARFGQAATVGQAGIQNAENTGAANIGAEKTASDRAALNYGIQQENTKYGSEARRGGQQEFRGWTAGQTGEANQGVQQGIANRMNQYGLTTGATSKDTGTATGWRENQDNNSFTSSFKKAAGNSLGSWMSRPGSGPASKY